MKHIFKIGDKVIKNPDTWVITEFDDWGRGNGIGVVVEPPFPMGEHEADIRWPDGRCFEQTIELLPYVETK